MVSSTVQEIEAAIATLSSGELQELYTWLEQTHPQPIDQRIAADLDAGLLDRAIVRALHDAEQGNTRPL